MNSIIRTATVAALVVCGLEAGAAAQSATSSQPSITPFSGTLLRIEDQGRVTVALATSEGILLADPLSLETARALKDQFAVRFPNQPVRYVVYTHHHFERASGASVFNQTAEILAHERFGQERQASAERLLAGEARGGRTQSALYEAILAPDESFRRTHVITLGGQRIALFHVDLHTPDMTVLFFPAQRVLFVGDAVPLDSVPASVGPSGVERTVASLRLLESLDFDQILAGDGRVGSKADLSRLRAYFEDLLAGVKAGFKEGQSVDAVVDALRLPQHVTLPGVLAGRPRHIAEVFAAQPKQRFDLYGAGNLFALQPRNCVSTDCSPIGGTTSGVTVGFGYQFGRAQFGAEVALLNPMTETRPEDLRFFLPPHTMQRSDQSTSFLGGLVIVDSNIRITAEAGFSLLRTKVTRTTFNGSAGVYVLENRATDGALAFGTQLRAPITNRVGIVVPVRFYYSSPAPSTTSNLSVTAGVGAFVNLDSKG